jgi:hypothetical protein
VADQLEPLIVEVPFDPEYLTDAGQYVAGYHWGKHIRSPQEFETPGHARGDWAELYPRFVQGVRDGYGDGLRHNGEIVRENEEFIAATSRRRARNIELAQIKEALDKTRTEQLIEHTKKYWGEYPYSDECDYKKHAKSCFCPDCDDWGT